MPEERHRDPEHQPGAGTPEDRVLVYRILRYVPNLLRDEWVNIGVLLYDPNTGERRLRLIEEEGEYNRLRRLHPRLDETSLRGLREHLESRFGAALLSNGNGGPIVGTSQSTVRDGAGNPEPDATEWLKILEKWDATLSQSLQLADPRATTADDITAEIDRLYEERVAVVPAHVTRAQTSAPRTRPQMRNYMDQVFRQAGLWGLIQKSVPISKFTRDDDPMLLDYSYLHHDHKMRGFIQTISLTNKPEDVRILTLAAKTIQKPVHLREPDIAPEFTAVTDTDFEPGNADHRFLDKLLVNNGVAHLPLDNFAVWVAKLRPMLQ
jgi:hypothetical protein